MSNQMSDEEQRQLEAEVEAEAEASAIKKESLTKNEEEYISPEKKNPTGRLVESVAYITLFVSCLVGLIYGMVAIDGYLDFDDFSFIIFITWVAVGVVSWIMLRAFSEIIYILDEIRNKRKK